MASVNPTQLSSSGQTRIKICGTHLTDDIKKTSISIGGRLVTVLESSTDNCIECLSPPILADNSVLLVHVAPHGKAAAGTATVSMSSVHLPKINSIGGNQIAGSSGDTLILHGEGFSTVPLDNVVEIVSIDQQCNQFNTCTDTKALTQCVPTLSTSIRIEVSF